MESEQEVKEIIKGMKRDSKYRCLSSKEDVKRVVQKIRRNRMKREMGNDLEELSIEEEIMVENVDDREQRNPTMAILTSDNYLPPKTHNLICSLILFEEPNYKNNWVHLIFNTYLSILDNYYLIFSSNSFCQAWWYIFDYLLIR